MSYTPPKHTDLTLTRLIAAQPEQVFDVWLDSSSPGGPWYGAKRAIVQPQVDGLFYHCVEFQGREWAHYGRFTILDRPSCIEHTWVSEGTRGLESVVHLTFEKSREQTLVTLRHSNVPDDDFGRQHAQGWDFVLGAIAQRLSPKVG
jgi:uncharacterized protein YndB with AHSA1/START domain